MRPWNPWGRNDDGSAALEFIAVGVILLVPLLYLVVALGAIQEQTLGAEAAARHTARVIALAPDAATAAARGDRVLDGIIDEYGMDRDATTLTVGCGHEAVSCPAAGEIMTVTVTTRVSLPLIPPVFGLDDAAAVTIEATAVQKVSRMWGAP